MYVCIYIYIYIYTHTQNKKRTGRRRASCWQQPRGSRARPIAAARSPVSSRGVGGSGHGYKFHHPRFRFLMAPWAPRASCVSSKPRGSCARPIAAARSPATSQFEINLFTEMCSGSEAGSYLRLIDFVYLSTLGLRVIKRRRRATRKPRSTDRSSTFACRARFQRESSCQPTGPNPVYHRDD